jgi:aminoglycoside phosphotransferase (APT) family kinase protein
MLRSARIVCVRQELTPALASRLVAAQFPQWAHLPVSPVELDGWDNTTFRLGDELAVRLPTSDAHVSRVEKEHRWLPALVAELPLPIPELVARGWPDEEFARPWSIYRWIEGDPASIAGASSLTDFATDLAGFLSSLYAIDATGGPAAGPHSAFRGGPLDIWDAEVRESIQLLADEIDTEAATEVWETALANWWERSPVWAHGDVAPSNLLVRDGRLAAVIDFGCSAVGDPACDLAIAWTFFAGESRQLFQKALPFDDATWARGRGWTLWKALITAAQQVRGDAGAGPGARRFGWRWDARGVIDQVLGQPGHA